MSFILADKVNMKEMCSVLYLLCCHSQHTISFKTTKNLGLKDIRLKLELRQDQDCPCNS